MLSTDEHILFISVRRIFVYVFLLSSTVLCVYCLLSSYILQCIHWFMHPVFHNLLRSKQIAFVERIFRVQGFVVGMLYICIMEICRILSKCISIKWLLRRP